MRAAIAERKPDHTEAQEGKVGWALAWLIGVPLPVLLVIFLVSRAC